MASADARLRYAKRFEEIDLKRAFEKIDTKKDGKVDAQELLRTLVALGHKASKAEVEDMIWEVDEDCDGLLSWEEFQRFFHRVNKDNTGFEPRRLFNVVQFVMNDKESRGKVSLEEAMQIMYLRYGRVLLDSQLEQIFGTSDINSGKTLSLTEFLTSLHSSQVKQLRMKVTARSYKAPKPGKKRTRSQ